MKITYAQAYHSLSHGDGRVYREYCRQEGIEPNDHAADLLDDLLACRREAEGLDRDDETERAA